MAYCLADFQKAAIAKMIWLCVRNLARYTNTANFSEKKVVLWQGKFIKGAVKIVEVKIAKQGKSFYKFKQI